ncbi:MAG: hypothetical protein F6J87_00545 [Spirulina sp. SIO3F2]|nr:hypothetical protein [Spirulina sp. SIO3F2]
MSLFTSSSSPAQGSWRVMVRPAIAGLLLLILYQGLIWLGAIAPSPGINQWQENIIHAERYLYQRQSAPLVLVGSSLAANLELADLDPAAVNLGMAGGCSQTGLAVVLQRQPLPATVLIEINDTLDRQLDQDFVRQITQPILRPIRQGFSSFRGEYTPLSVVVSWLKGSDPPEIVPPDVTTASPLRQQEIERLTAENQAAPEPNFVNLLDQEVTVIKQQIAQLEKAGVEVILFNPPIEAELQNTPRQRVIHEELRSQFPKSRYRWLPDALSDWLTSDGLHLTPQEVERYTDWLGEQI